MTLLILMLINRLNVIWVEEGSRKWEKTVLSVISYRKEEMRPNPKPHQSKLLICTDLRGKKEKEIQLLIQ